MRIRKDIHPGLASRNIYNDSMALGLMFYR